MIDFSQQMQRIRQLGIGPQSQQAAEGLLALLDASPWLRREVSLRDLAYLMQISEQPRHVRP